MSSKIQSIKIRWFRGIRELELPIKAHQDNVHNLVILGENGTGKSSIVDAIEYYFTGGVEKLQGRQDVRERECIPHLEGGDAEILVKLTDYPGYSKAVYPEDEISFEAASSQPEVATGKFARDQVPIEPLENYFREAKNRPFILRRAQLLSFINARPAQRYQLVSQLIGLDELDNIDSQWRRELNQIRSRHREQSSDYQNALNDLTTYIEADVESEPDVLDAVNNKLKSFDLPPISKREELEARQDAVATRAIDEERLNTAQKLKTLAGSVQQVQTLFETSEKSYQKLHQEQQRFLKTADQIADAQYEKLLRAAQELMETGVQFDTCPLCEQDIPHVDHFHERLEARLKLLADLTRLKKMVNQSKTETRRQVEQLTQKLTELVDDIGGYELDINLGPIIEIKRVGSGWLAKLNNDDWQIYSPQTLKQELTAAQATSHLAALEEALEYLSEQFSPTEAERKILERIDWLARVDEKWRRWQTESVEFRKIDEVLRQITIIYDTLVEAKKEGLNDILNQVQGLFKTFYQQLHPEEGYGDITLPVEDRRTSSSVGLETDFLGQRTDHPLGYFSEGHLDSLGLCIFLAFIKHFNTDFRLIVLDDVLTSVDAGHRIRVAQLLVNEFKEHQLFITTHDEMWANQLATAMNNANMHPKLIRLKPWTLAEGTGWDEYTGSDWSHYRHLAESGHTQDAAAGVGRLLEKFLYMMRRNLGLAVPATPDDRYTIGHLYDPFFSWVESHPLDREDMPDYVETVTRLRMELDDYWRLRNWSGAHYNEWGSNLTSNEAIAFIEILAELTDLFQCPRCNNLVKYDQTAKMVYCSHCVRKPQPRVVWQFKPNWEAGPQRLLSGQAGDPRQARQNAVRATQSAFEKFLRDARRRFSLPIPATMDDRYDLEHLYEPFFEWASNHPRPKIDDRHIIRDHKAILDQYLTQDHAWLPVSEIVAEADTFFKTTQQIISMFQCPQGHLLSFEAGKQRYHCPICDNGPEMGAPAQWYVRGSN